MWIIPIVGGGSAEVPVMHEPITAEDIAGLAEWPERLAAGEGASEGGENGEGEHNEPPARSPRGPRLNSYRFIPKDGNPNRLLERYPLKEALDRVTRDHRRIADWIRAQRGRPGWERLDQPTPEMWPYIHASKRLKLCRQQLEEIRDNVLSEGDSNSDNDALHDWIDAQSEANALAAQSMADKVRSGWPGEGMYA